MLNKNKILAHLADPQIALEIFDVIDSTQDYLLAQPSATMLQIVLAEQQIQGRGRSNKVWESPRSKNIYASIQRIFNKKNNELQGLSLVLGLAIAKKLANALENQSDLKFAIKWPNDIFFEHAKIAGILIDVVPVHGGSRVIIGVGINVNMEQSQISISQPWTSLIKITRKKWDRNVLIAQCINQIKLYLDQFDQRGFTFFLDQWPSYDYLFDKKIGLKNNVVGIAKGVNAQGELIVELANGERICTNGEILMINR